MHIWEEAVRTVVYVQNCTPHRVLDNKTLEEAFSGEKPKVSHLRIFGFLVYIHIPKEKRTKLDPSGRKGIFVGYSDTSKTYQIYFPRFKNINISRDVTFDEDSAYSKYRKLPIEEVDKPEATRVRDMKMEETTPEYHEYHDITEPQEIVEPLHDNISFKKNHHGHER